MNPLLQPIAGLYQLIETKLKQAAWNRTKAEFPRTDPHISHEAGVSAEQAVKDVEKHEAHVRSNIAIINTAELLIHDLLTSTIQSAPRKLAMRELESASMRLRRELGDRVELPCNPVDTVKEKRDRDREDLED
jgi:hypothetical protein